MKNKLQIMPEAMTFLRAFIKEKKRREGMPIRIYKTSAKCPGGFNSVIDGLRNPEEEVIQVEDIKFFVRKELLKGEQFLMIGYHTTFGFFVEQVKGKAN